MISSRREPRLGNDPQGKVSRHLALALTTLLTWALVCRAQQNPAAEATPQPKRLTVAVLWFENGTADPNLAHWVYAAAMLHSSELGEVKAIRLLSDGAVHYAFRQVGIHAGDPIDPNAARQMGEHIEAQRVIWGRYSRKDDQWHVDARVVNVATGEASGTLSAAASDWFDLRDKLNDRILAQLGITPTSEEKAKMAKRWTRSPEALDWLARVLWLQEQGKPVSELETLCRNAIAADPNCAPAYGDLAATLATQGKFNLADDAIQRALQLDPNSAQVHAILGFLYGNQKQLERAKDQFQQACRLNPDSAEHLTRVAQVCAAQGKWNEATASLETAVSLDRTDALAHVWLARVHAARKRRDEALQELQETARFMPDTPIVKVDILLILGMTYELLGRNSEAILHYGQVVSQARKLAANPNAIRGIETAIKRLESTLTPTFIDAAMPKRYTEQALDQLLRERLTEAQYELIAHPFLCNDEMRQWARDLTRDAASDLDKARAIFDALTARAGAYGRPTGRTPQEVYRLWKNTEVPLRCLDHAVLFVALAKVVDVNAFLVQVIKDPDGEVIAHGCAAVFAGDRALLVDPQARWFGVPHRQYVIMDDLEATVFLCFTNRAEDPRELAFCRAGLKLSPDSLIGRLSLVGALGRANQHEEARRVFSGIPEPQSESYEAAGYWACRGQLAGHERDVKRAEEYLLKAISIYPYDAWMHYLLGITYQAQRRLSEARDEFRACLRNDPHPANALLARRRIVEINEQIGFGPSVNPDASKETPP